MHFDNYSIRLLTLEDLDSFYTLVNKNRGRLEDFFTGTVSRTKTIEDTRDFLVEMEGRMKEKSYFPYIIIDNSKKSIIGFIDLKNIDWSIPKTELGCYIDEEYAGQGITRKAFQLICTHCFEEHKFRKLFLRTHPNNLSARAVAEKCGFEVEGIIRQDYKTTSGKIIDLVYYGRLR